MSNELYGEWINWSVAINHTHVPDVLFSVNKYIHRDENKITPTEMLVLLQLLSMWKDSPAYPDPSKSLLAMEVGLGARQIQRALSNLELKGYITKIYQYDNNNSRTSNAYDLSGIISLLRNIVREKRKIDRKDCRSNSRMAA